MSRWRFLPILLAVAGCDWKVTTRVGVQVTAPLPRARDDGTRDAPVPGALVRVECPGGDAQQLGRTDVAGWVLITTRAAVALDCALTIEHGGRSTASIPVSEACTLKEANECRALEVRVGLGGISGQPLWSVRGSR